MSNGPVQETKGVSVQVLATVDLESEIEGLEGRQLRMRIVHGARRRLRPGS
jgi:hypothetical protein